MNDRLKLERLIFDCPEVDCLDYTTYPPLIENDFMLMHDLYLHDDGKVRSFFFLRETKQVGKYVEIYIWNKESELNPTRFIIRPGYRLNEEYEEMLFYAARSYITENEDYLDRVCEQLIREFPEWHLTNYMGIDGEMHLIDNLYYVSHRAGPREILYKAGLNWIAYYLDLLEYNLIGKTPEQIVGHNVPNVRFLRVMNDPELFYNLCNAERTEYCIRIYREFAPFLTDTNVSSLQWCYLKRLYERDGFFEFNRRLFNHLANTDYDEEMCEALDCYAVFFRMREKMEHKVANRMKIPDIDHVVETVERISEEQRLLGDTLLAKKVQRRAIKEKYFEYSDENYSVYLPRSVQDYCREAYVQQNCLRSFIQDHANHDITILFVRENKCPNKRYVDIMVGENEIKEVRTKNNLLPSGAVYRFIEKYACVNHLTYRPEKLIPPCACTSECYEDERSIKDYLADYKARTQRSEYDDPLDDCFTQLSFYDLYPELLNSAG